MVDLVPIPTTEFRALMLHDVVPAGHIAVPILHSRWEPHIRAGEFAILDATDTEPQFGELYGLMIGSPESPRGTQLKIVQPYRSPLFTRDDGCVMYRFGAAWGSYADGPLRPEWWQRKCRGRVVGVMIPEAAHV